MMKGQIIKEVKPLTKEQAEYLAKNYNMGASTEAATRKEELASQVHEKISDCKNETDVIERLLKE